MNTIPERNTMTDPPIDPPVLAYGGPNDPNSGFAGSDTSEERARRADDDGTTAMRQWQTIRALAVAGTDGLTYKELGEILDLHHGQSSGVLSSLHKAGRIARLAGPPRGRCKVYVLDGHVAGRPTEPHGNTARTSLMAEMADALAVIEACHHRQYVGGCLSCRAADILDRYRS